MKKLMKETSIFNKRGRAVRVVTYGYNTKIPGVDVIRVMGERKDFTIVHRGSGLSLGLYSAKYTKLIKFANTHLAEFDFSLTAEELVDNHKLADTMVRYRREVE